MVVESIQPNEREVKGRIYQKVRIACPFGRVFYQTLCYPVLGKLAVPIFRELWRITVDDSGELGEDGAVRFRRIRVFADRDFYDGESQ